MSNSKRIIVDISILVSLLFLPWWVPCLIAIFACWYCDFYEMIILGFLIDTFYASGYFFNVSGYFISYGFTITAFLMLFALRKLKKRVRFSA